MTWEKFWSIIDRVRAQADMQDEASVKQFLYTELIKLPQDELLGFDCAWQSYRNKANFPKMVAAACIINDGSSDDRFTDFRNWLIMQGYDAYRQALIDPDNLAALNIPFRDTEWMGCGNVAWYAYAGQKLRTYFEKAGIAAELHRRYPTLLKLPDDLHRAIMQEQLAPHRAQETEWERQMLRTEVKHYIDTSGLAYSYNEFYKLAEIWSLLTESPQTFKGGQVWGVMTGIHSALQAIGYGLLVLFFAVGVMKTCGSFVEVKKPEHALKLFIRFALAKGAVTYGLELMLAVFSIVQGMVSTIITQSGNSGMSSVTLPQELIDAINNVGFWDSIPLWAVTLIGGLLITVLSFTMILTVYGRMFSLWMYAAIAPIPLSTFAGEPTSSVGKNFIRSYAGVCLQGVVIALSCIIFSAISSSPPAVDTGASVVTAVWTYVGELAFNLLVLVGAIKGCDRIVKEIMGL